MVNEEHRWEAPGTLELVRTFLNTGLPSAGPGQDRLVDLRADPERWAATFGDLRRPGPRRLAELVELRDGLRRLLAAAPAPADAAWLSGWCRRTGLGARVGVEGDRLAMRLACPPRSGLAGAVVEAVVAALSDGSWSRLRQCPDCRLVFWDRTRNASKVWCGMYAGSDGRACGSIAKVRRYSKAFTDGLEAAGAVPYVHSLRDPVQVQRFWDLGIPVYSDEPFPPLATAAARPPALQDPTFSDADGTPPA